MTAWHLHIRITVTVTGRMLPLARGLNSLCAFSAVLQCSNAVAWPTKGHPACKKYCYNNCQKFTRWF